MRKKLLDTIKAKGIEDKQVLEAMMNVPRHFFLEKAFLDQAYSDNAFQIGAGQTISQPFTVAYQTSLLQLQRGDKVLEIGTGSGYQTSVLVKMGVKVFSIERQKELYDKASFTLKSIGIAAKLFYGDGYKGLPSYAPFDKILVTCGAPSVPEGLLQQLKIGGIMVIPVGEGPVQIMKRIVRISETEFKTTELDSFRFVPMLENKEWGKKLN